MSRNTPLLRRLRVAGIGLGLFAVSCSSATEVAEPPTTTETPRQVAPDETTSTTSSAPTPTTTTTTTTVAPPAPPVIIDALGSIRTLPGSTAPSGVADTSDESDEATDDAVTNVSATNVTVTTLGCTISTDCAPEDLADWAAGEVDVVNLATSAAAVDGVDVLDEHSAALGANGVSSIGYGETLNAALEPMIVRGSDRPVAIYSISLATDLDSEVIATNTTPGIAAGPVAFDFLVERVADSRAAGQSTVIMVDWGQIEDRAPSEEEVEQIQPFIRVGADAIVGHGSDFLQRFEKIDETAIAFNLGNALTANDEPLRRDSAVLRIQLEEAGDFTCLLPAEGSEFGIVLDDPAGAGCQTS